MIPVASTYGHSILVRAKSGDHWECTCGRWWFDSPRALDLVETLDVIREWDDHIEFERKFG